MKAFAGIIFTLTFLSLISFAEAQLDVVDANRLKAIVIPIHVFELILALFIAYMALKFFRITRPLGLFLYIYTAIGFFIISSSLYLYLHFNPKLETNFISVHIGSRIALIGMLISFVIFFYQWNRVMKKVEKK